MQLIIQIVQLISFLLFLNFYKQFAFKENCLHLSFFHFVYYFIFYYIGGAAMYAEGGYSNHKYIISVISYPLVALGGMFLASQIKVIGKINFLLRRSNLYIVYLFIFVISLLYLFSLESVPLLYVLKGDALAAALSRSNATKGFEGFKLVYYLFRVVVDYFLIYILILKYIDFDRFSKSFVAIFIISSIVCVIDTQKYPLINLILIVLTTIYLRNQDNNRFKLKLSTLLSPKMALLVFLAYFVLGLLWSAIAGRLGERTSNEIFSSIFESANSMMNDRLIDGENRPLYAIYNMVPDKYDYFFGRTFPNPLRLMPFDPVPLSFLVFDEVHPNGEAVDGVLGAAPTVFFSVIYANFGIGFSFISMFLFGFLVQILNDMLNGKGKYILPYRMVLINYIALFATSIDIPFLSEKVLSLLSLYFLMYKTFPANRR